MKRKCCECGRTEPKGGMYKVELFDTPWENVPHVRYVCKVAPQKLRDHYCYGTCLQLLTDTSWSDFRYFYCSDCGRMICEQNPSNGWHTQYRVIHDEQICLRCFERHVLENGVDRETLEEGHLQGMFFSNDNHEPIEAGYEHIRDVFVQSNAESVCEELLGLIDQGHKVLIGYESMAIGGGEGTVSLWVKKKAKTESEGEGVCASHVKPS